MFNRSDPTSPEPRGWLPAAAAAREVRDAHTGELRGFRTALRHSRVPKAPRRRRAFRAEPLGRLLNRRTMVPVPRGPFPQLSPFSNPPFSLSLPALISRARQCYPPCLGGAGQSDRHPLISLAANSFTNHPDPALTPLHSAFWVSLPGSLLLQLPAGSFSMPVTFSAGLDNPNPRHGSCWSPKSGYSVSVTGNWQHL